MTNDVVTVDSVAWAAFIFDYDRYNKGDAKMPFSQVRESLAAVIDSADRTHSAQAVPSIEDLCARIKAADDAAADNDYMLDSDDCIKVLRGEWQAPLAMDKPALPTPKAAPDDEVLWRALELIALRRSDDPAQAAAEALVEFGHWRVPVTPEAQPAVATDTPPLTPDEARQAARFADSMRGPSDTTRPADYAMAGALAFAAKIAAQPAVEPVAYLHDDGYWTAAKTEQGRALSDRLHFAGSPKIGVHLHPEPTTPAAPAPVEWVQSKPGHPYWPHSIPPSGVPLPDGWLDDYITDCAKLKKDEMPGVYFVQGVRFAEQHHACLVAAPADAVEPVFEGGRESVDDAIAVVESFGPGISGLNDTFARQILLADEVKRLRKLYESAVTGRADMRGALREARRSQTADKATKLDFTKPLETHDEMPVKWVAHDVVEYQCARVCVDAETGVVYSSPYVGLKIRNVEPVAAPADALDAETVKDAERYRWLRDCVLVDGVVNDSIYVRVDHPSYPNLWALTGIDLDEAIDAAQAAQGGE